MAKRKRPAGDADARAAKLARRQERQAEEAAARRRAERLSRLRTWGLVAAAVAVVAVGLFFALRPDPELAGVGRPPGEGRDHVPEGQAQYDSAAPTSGAHVVNAPPCRVYNEMVPLELAVHALEHGTVVLWYQPEVEDDVLDDLRDIEADYDSHVIVSPNPGIDDPIVATAWNRRKAYDSVVAEVDEFVSVYRQRGPEQVDCPNN